MVVTRCPRCGEKGYLIEDHRELKHGHQVYYFILHRYKDEFGRWKTRKCAIGSTGYINVTKTHRLPLLGVDTKFSNVLTIDRHVELIIELIRNLVRRRDFKQEYLDKIRKYIESYQQHV